RCLGASRQGPRNPDNHWLCTAQLANLIVPQWSSYLEGENWSGSVRFSPSADGAVEGDASREPSGAKVSLGCHCGPYLRRKIASRIFSCCVGSSLTCAE